MPKTSFYHKLKLIFLYTYLPLACHFAWATPASSTTDSCSSQLSGAGDDLAFFNYRDLTELTPDAIRRLIFAAEDLAGQAQGNLEKANARVEELRSYWRGLTDQEQQAIHEGSNPDSTYYADLKSAAQAFEQATAYSGRTQMHLQALHRIRDKGATPAFSISFRGDLDLPVRGKNSSDLAGEVLAHLESLGFQSGDLLYRFVDPSREDLVRSNGTDRNRDTSVYFPADHHLNSQLDRQGQSLQNSIYALSRDDFRYGYDRRGPYPMMDDFRQGTKILVVYRPDFFLPLNTVISGAYAFKWYLPKKRWAVVGIIKPVQD